MRLASVLLDGRPRLAGRTAAGLFDLTGQDSALTGVSDVLAEDDGLGRAAAALDRARRVGPTLEEGALRWRPLLTSAGKVLALGLNYADHAAESPYDRPDYPVVFPRFTTSLLGHGEPICRPVDSDQLDFEGELVAVIGRTARRVPVDEALQAVAGYSLFNDATIRDFQFRTHQWTVGKNFDGTGPFGPELVTADELPEGAKGLRLRTTVNDQVVQDADTSDMLFSVAEAVALLSEAMTLQPGDALVMGTPAGIGFARDPQLFLRPGDTVTVTVDGVGTLSNPVVAAPTRRPVPVRTSP